MPRTRKRAKERRRALTPDDLTIGDGLDFIVGWKPGDTSRSRWRTWEDYREAWEELREYMVPRSDCPAGSLLLAAAGNRPSAWWRFDSPEPRRAVEPEHEQLARLGLLADWEQQYLAAQPEDGA